MMAKQNLIGVSEVARRLGLSAVRIRQLADTGALPPAHVTLNGARFFSSQAIERVRQQREKKMTKKLEVSAMNR